MIKFSRREDYAIILVNKLAKEYNKRLVPLSEIAAEYEISLFFLRNLANDLRTSGIIQAVEGKTGGYALAKAPEDIKMSLVMRTLEGPIAMVPCVSLNFYEKCDDCPDETLCGVHTLMAEVRDKTLDIFNNKSLADLV